MYDMEKWLAHIEEGIARGPYAADWDSLSQHETPRWFRDAKFGIFIHWGVYSVPAFRNEWYPRSMYIQGTPEFEHHVKTYGPQSQFGYRDFIPMFRAERFDPEAWAELFAESGARYVVPVAEHHDGFQMYRSELSEWNAWEKGPKRDVIMELTDAAGKRGLLTGASSHRIEHWFFFDHGRDFPSDVPANAEKRGDFYWPSVRMDDDGIADDNQLAPAPTKEFLDDWMIRTAEIIDRFHPCELYFDWWIMHEAARPYLKKIAAYYYNSAAARGEEVMIANKNDAFPFGTAVADTERGSYDRAQVEPWQTDTAIAKNSWCYTPENEYKRPGVILNDLVDAVAKNGSMLLNVGPKADGTISDEDAAILREIGAWLRVNGEAVYGSRPFRIAEEGPTGPKGGAFADRVDTEFTSEDFRFTVNHGRIYVFAMHWPESGRVNVRSLGRVPHPTQTDFNALIGNVELLGFENPDGSPREVCWERNEEGLSIRADGVSSDSPVVFRVTLK